MRGEVQPLNPARQGDPYGVPLASLLDVKQASEDARRGFVRKVYGLLSVQMLLTLLVALPFQFLDTEWLGNNVWLVWLSTAMTLGLACALSCSPGLARTYPTNEICLFMFTAFEGVLVGFVSAAFPWQSVFLAAGITVTIVLSLTVYAFFTSTDFTGLGIYLFAALLVVVLFGLVVVILSAFGVNFQWLTVTYNLLGILVFMVYIIFDTQLILGSWGGHQHEFSLDDYVFATLTLYLDVINLFLHVLSALNGGRGD